MVAALEREVAPLVRSWHMRPIEHDGRKFRLFENGDVALICGGIGAASARRATEAIVQEVRPDRVLSVGFAGALDPALAVADVLEPRTVINAADGARTDTGRGRGTLVSFTAVAGREQKHKLREAYGAVAVDMEAAAVAQGADLRGVSFGALKVISDEANKALPPLDEFIDAQGNFRAARFSAHVALRPWLWRATFSLARDSARASQSLSHALQQYLKSEMETKVTTHG